MIAGLTFALSRLRLILLPLLVSGVFAATAFGQSPAPLYRTVGRTTGKALGLKAAATTPAGQVAPSGRVTTLDRASLASFSSLRKGLRVVLPLTDAVAVSGTVNLVGSRAGWTDSGGSLDEATPGSFYFNTDGVKVEGYILRPDLQVAYRFETLPSGETMLREVSINTVVCGFLPPFLNDPTAKAQTNAGPQANIVPPILNSRPGAVAQIYLDFDGETITDPYWNGGNTIVAAPAQVNATDINAIFQRVKEDYWPFDINVTTDPAKYFGAPVGQRTRCIITPTNTAAPGAGGVAIIGGFNHPSSTGTTPCWVFNPGIVGIAEAISHECGHTFGLYHDGRELPDTGHEEYFQGQGSGDTSWCPIMGAAYYVAVSQFSIGEYQYANNRQDDLAIIASNTGVGYAPDDGNHTTNTAFQLGGTTNGNVSQEGTIEKAGESDYYYFTTTGGRVSFSAVGAPDPNLDIVLELQSGDGATLVSSNPPGGLSASLTATLERGTYFLHITDSGAFDKFTNGYSTYGSIGLYALTGTVPGLGTPFLPNLGFTTPQGANDRLIVSNTPGSNVDAPTYYATDELYLDFSVKNDGDGIVTKDSTTAIFVDGVLKGSLTLPAGLANGGKVDTNDYDIGMLSVGQHTIRIQADNGMVVDETSENDNSVSRTIVVTLPGPPTIISPSTANGQVNALFFYAIQATNQPDSYQADGLPSGLYIKQGTNVITGAPTTAGTYNVTLRASNVVGTGQSSLTITILPAVPVITSAANATAEVGTPFTFQVTAANSSAGYSALGLPPGLVLDRASGIISGTPTAPGTYTVSLQASNAGGTGISNLTISVLVAPPVFTSATTAQGRVGAPFVFQVTANGNPTEFGAAGLPDGLTIDPVTGKISGTPRQEGTFPVTLFATNSNRTVTFTLTLTITDAPPVQAWGTPENAAVPADLEDGTVVALAAGAQHSVALRNNGKVEAWGVNNVGQLNVPADLTDVVSVSAGAYHNLALRRDGTVVAWGSNDLGQTNVPAGLKDVVAVAAGTTHSLALRSDGTVIGWGNNTYGQITPPGDLKNVVGIAAGGFHSLALRADGTVVGFGSNTSGQINIPTTLTGVIQIAAGTDFSVLLRGTGSVVAIGSNSAGQLVLPANLLDAVKVAAGGQHALAVRQNGTVVTWGSNSRGESTPPDVLLNVATIAAGVNHSVALVQRGAPRAIVALPSNGTAALTSSVSLLAYAVGTGPLAYQWTRNGTDLPNATLPYLEFGYLTTAQEGTYAFRVTNATGSATSAPTKLTLTAAQPTITAAVSNPNTSPGSAVPGEITLTRTGDTNTELVVNYVVKGSAVNGQDYQTLKGTKKFKAGKASVKIRVIPTGGFTGTTKAVKFTLQPGSGYTVGTTETLKVKIINVQE